MFVGVLSYLFVFPLDSDVVAFSYISLTELITK